MNTVSFMGEKWGVGQYVTWYQQGAPYESFALVEAFDNREDAYRFCNYLNGGKGLPFPALPESEATND